MGRQVGLGVDGESSHFHVSGKKKKHLYGKDEMKIVLWEQRMNVSRNGVNTCGGFILIFGKTNTIM